MSAFSLHPSSLRNASGFLGHLLHHADRRRAGPVRGALHRGSSRAGWDDCLRRTGDFYALGGALALVLLAAGLAASFFHLGRPERSWRAVAMWRTSWLSREVIVLPVFMAVIAAWSAAHFYGAGGTLAVGALGIVLCFALFVCTGMIYACIRFLQEWATPLTVVNYTLLGCACGFTAGAAYAAVAGDGTRAVLLGWCAVVLTLVGVRRRGAPRSSATPGCGRDRACRPRSGSAHPRIEQKSQGFMGGSFNTREFFHGRTPARRARREVDVPGARFSRAGGAAARGARQGLAARRWRSRFWCSTRGSSRSGGFSSPRRTTRRTSTTRSFREGSRSPWCAALRKAS